MNGLRITGPLRRLTYLRDLLRELVVRDIKLRYKRSFLGVAWSLLNPLAQLLVFHFVFRLVLPLNIPNYAAFLFTGILVWTWFQTSLLTATGSIVDNPDLIKRPGFPATVLPVVAVTTHLIHFLLALPILLLFLLLGGIQPTGAFLALPVVIILQFLLTLGLSYLVAAVYVTFRDTQYLLGLLLLLGFYLSPTFYEVRMIPQHYQLLYHLNPMANLIDAYRQILLHGAWPGISNFLVIVGMAVLFFWVGYTIFVQASYRFVEEI